MTAWHGMDASLPIQGDRVEMRSFGFSPYWIVNKGLTFTSPVLLETSLPYHGQRGCLYSSRF